jgi:mRNA biogenesis factor
VIPVLGFEAEIAELEGKVDLTAKESKRLRDLQAEVTRIQKKKEEYVAQHPEQRKLVYRSTRKNEEQMQPKPVLKRNLFDEHGRPRHPERSIYYDPVFNRTGAPPPGMPYLERRKFDILCRSSASHSQKHLFLGKSILIRKMIQTVCVHI